MFFATCFFHFIIFVYTLYKSLGIDEGEWKTILLIQRIKLHCGKM